MRSPQAALEALRADPCGARLLRAFRMELFGSGAVVPRGFVTTQPDRPVRFMLTRRIR